MAKLNPETIKANAIRERVLPYPCSKHGSECVITDYMTAEQSSGGKAHAYSYTYHSAEPDTIRGQGAPYCGSRNRSSSAHGAFVAAVTCGRC